MDDKRWIKTGGKNPKQEGTFVEEAEKKNVSVKKLMNTALKYKTRADFGKGEQGDQEYQSWADKNPEKVKLRKQAQMVKNMGNYEKGGNVDKKITSLDDIETPNFQEKSPDDFGQSEGVKEVTPNTISEEENKTANRNLDKDAKTLVSLKEAETK